MICFTGNPVQGAALYCRQRCACSKLICPLRILEILGIAHLWRNSSLLQVLPKQKSPILIPLCDKDNCDCFILSHLEEKSRFLPIYNGINFGLKKILLNAADKR